MRIIQMSLKIQILGFFIKAKPFPQYDEVLTIIIRNFSVENTNYQYLSIYEKTNNVSYLLAETWKVASINTSTEVLSTCTNT